MTVQDYNNKFLPVYNKASSFVSCLEHALEKSDDNARMQLRVIGWDEQTKMLLLHALSLLKQNTNDTLKFECADWWPKEEDNDR